MAPVMSVRVCSKVDVHERKGVTQGCSSVIFFAVCCVDIIFSHKPLLIVQGLLMYQAFVLCMAILSVLAVHRFSCAGIAVVDFRLMS